MKVSYGYCGCLSWVGGRVISVVSWYAHLVAGGWPPALRAVADYCAFAGRQSWLCRSVARPWQQDVDLVVAPPHDVGGLSFQHADSTVQVARVGSLPDLIWLHGVSP
jgi:hypothetical protein